MSEDNMIFYGVVESCSHDIFFVKVENPLNKKVKCTLGRRLRANRIRVMPSDYVTIAVSPYDTGFETGKIISRDTVKRG
jgi:translation initiation factor IF-1